MKTLYALPDHEVIMDLIPGIAQRHLGHEDALRRIGENSGVVPVAIDPSQGGKVLWADIGDLPYREWQFMYTIQSAAQQGAITDSFTTDMDVLRTDGIFGQTLYPSGFIFHISRCGSTLTAKALARLEKNVVVNQGGPLQRGFWAYLSDDWRAEVVASEDNLAMFRNLVFGMARKRRESEQASFVKFISWNVLYLDFVVAAFPDVPCLFLYRDPVEVIASVKKETTAVLLAKGKPQATFLTNRDYAETASMTDTAYLGECYANYFRAALSGAEEHVRYLNYTDINSRTFSEILGRGLKVKPSPGELEYMREQFKYHSKDDSDATKFRSDSSEKRASMSEEECRTVTQTCSSFVDQLDRSPRNLFSKIGASDRQKNVPLRHGEKM